MQRIYRKSFIVLSIISIFLVFLMIFSFGCAKKEDKEIQIGVISSQTGTISPYGQSVWEGIQIAVNELSQKYGIGGKKIKIILEDDQSDPKVAVSAINKLIDTNKVSVIIGPVASSSVMSVAPIANEKKVVILSPAAASPNITTAGDYIFRNRATGTLEASNLADFAYNKGIQKAAILYINTDYGVGYKDIITNRFSELGGKIVHFESFDQGVTDFRTQISKLKNLKVNTIFLLGNPTEVGFLIKQSKEQGFRPQFLSNNVESEELLKVAGNAAEGLIFVLPAFNPNSSSEQVKYFVEKYKEKFNKMPDLYAANAYDAVYLVKMAIEKGGYTGDGIKNALYQIKNYKGVNGTLTFDKNGDVVKPLMFKTISKGKYIPY